LRALLGSEWPESSTQRGRMYGRSGAGICFSAPCQDLMTYLAGARVRSEVDSSGYPHSLAAVRALPDIELSQTTILVGDNGSGKSTLVEALAVAADFNAEGGSRNLMFETHATHSALAGDLKLRWHKRPRWGWFLRAETFYGMATHIERDEWLKPKFPNLHARSHGESFLDIIDAKMQSDGLFLLDEPESALSFHGQLKLLSVMHQATLDGAQFVLATHSPILMSFPGASIYELGDNGAQRVSFDEAEAVMLWRSFLGSPERFFHHLFDDGSADEPQND